MFIDQSINQNLFNVVVVVTFGVCFSPPFVRFLFSLFAYSMLWNVVIKWQFKQFHHLSLSLFATTLINLIAGCISVRRVECATHALAATTAAPAASPQSPSALRRSLCTPGAFPSTASATSAAPAAATATTSATSAATAAISQPWSYP